MSVWLKQSTAVDVVVGPFVDDTDFKTPETALTISQADIRLSKNGAAFAQTNNATGATHRENGHYIVPLDATDTNTLGRLRVAVHESGALAVWADFMIIPVNVWDSLFGADLLQVDTREVTGTAQTARDLGATLGAAGAGLTAVPWNAAWDAEVQSEVADALDAAVPGSPTAGSINERIKTMDDADLPTSIAAILDDTGTSGVVVAAGSKTGYALSAAGVQAIWDALTAALSTANSIGKRLVDNIDAAISSRSSHSAADVWASATRTLTSFGTLVADIWASATRTLTSFGTKLDRSIKTITIGTVGAGSTTTSVVTSSLSPAASVADQWKGQILQFADDTTTAALRGQKTDITANTAGGTLTVTALTTAPVSGDTFTIS